MRRFLTTSILGAALVAGSSVAAKANTLQVFVSAQQIINAANALTGTQFGNFCGASLYLNNCGVFAVGFLSDSLGTTGQVVQVNPSSFWSATTVLSAPVGTEDTGTAGTGREALITSDSTAPSGTYFSNIAATGVTATTDIQGTAGILFDVTTSAAAGTNDVITLILRTVNINSGTGTEGGSKGNSNITVTSALIATPEPSSVLLGIVGMIGIGIGRFRRSRR